MARNIRILPRHMLMKLKRAFVPVSPSGSREVMLANTYRAVVDMLAIGGLLVFLRRPGKMGALAAISLVSVFLAHILLVSMFCGLNRFALPSEILLVIPAGYMLVAAVDWRRGMRHGEELQCGVTGEVRHE